MTDTFVKGRPNIFFAFPTYGGHVMSEFMMSNIELAQTLKSNNIGAKFGCLSFPDIVEVRNIFLSIFYDKTPMATHIVMADSDMHYTPELILDMLNFDHPVVGIIATKKKYPIEFVGRGQKVEPEPVGNFMQVDGCGTGVIMITRECISEMLLKMPQIVDPYPIDRHPASELILAQGLTRLIRPFDPIVDMEIGRLSEDLSFSNRWIYGCGGEVWCEISHAVGHIGYHEFKASYLSFLAAKKAQEEQQKAEAMKVAAE